MGRRVSRRSVISRFLDEIRSPVFVLGSDRRIAYANAALGAWLELDSDAIAGLECQYSAQSASPVAGLCPPPDVFDGNAASGSVWRALADGSTEYRDAEFLPLMEQGDQRCSVMGILGTRSRNSPSGAASVPVKPLTTDNVELHDRLWRLRGDVANQYAIEQLIGETPAMLRVQQLVRTAVTHPGNVLILGEEGTGREHVARTIHRCGANGTMRPLTSAAAKLDPLATLSAPVLDTELLGTTVATLLGRCAELEVPGLPTLLLLDADQLEEPVQDVLFDLLNVHELELRCVSTARQSLIRRSRQQTFHPGLAYALSSLEIELPSLNDRRDDIPLLVQYFVEHRNLDAKQQVRGFTEEAISHFLVYPWSTHLSELKRLVEEACAAAVNATVGVEALPFGLRAAVDASLFAPQPPTQVALDGLLEAVEREAIGEALIRAQGNRAKAARMLEISRARLLRRMDHFGLGEANGGLGEANGGAAERPG